MTCREIKTLEIPAVPMILEGSWGSRGIGKYASTMTLYADERGEETDPASYFIEWDIPDLDRTECIGLWFGTGKRLEDYDGVCSLPREAVKLIRQCGFVVPRDMLA